MKNRVVRRVLCAALASLLVVNGNTLPVRAQTLSEAELTEDTRGYGGAGNQNKSRTEDTITVSVTFGAGGTDASWTGLAELTPYIANDDVEMLNRHVVFGDEDSDGDIDSTDLFRKLEEYKRGDKSFVCTTSDMGDFYTTIFGVDAGGSFTYWINGNYCNYGTPDLYDHDSLIVVAFTGEYNSWGETDDSAYDGHKGANVYTSLTAIQSLDSWETVTNPYAEPIENTDPVEDPIETPVEDPVISSPSSSRTKYLSLVESSLASGYQTSGTGLWQQLRLLRFAKGVDKDAFATYQAYFAENNGVALGAKAVDDMRVLSVVNNETAMNNLLYGPGLTIDDVEDSSEALVYDKKAGMYAMDYILMALDLTGAGLADDDLTNNLSDYTVTVSVRDDLVYTILNTAGCWGGGWFTYDTGCQNAQSLVPYYNRYPEVRAKLDEFEATAYEYFMNPDYTGASFDASCGGEYVRFASMLASATGSSVLAQHAVDVYDKIESIGIENTKYKGNTMDIWRMAIAEWGLNDSSIGSSSSSTIVGSSNDFRLVVDGSSVNGVSAQTVCHLVANRDIDDAQLYEAEFTVPSTINIDDVTSSVADVTFGVTGNILRVVVARLDGFNLNILKDADLLQINVTVTESGKVEFGVVSSKLWSSSEEVRNSLITVEESEVIEEASIAASVLYTGSESSRFIDKDLQAVKIVLGTNKDVEGTLQYKVGDSYYNCYPTTDFGASDSTRTFVSLLPVSVTVAELQLADNYYVADVATSSLMFGDTDADLDITSADALWIIKLWVGKITETTNTQILSANVTKDSDINNADTLSIVGNIVNGEQFKVLQ